MKTIFQHNLVLTLALALFACDAEPQTAPSDMEEEAAESPDTEMASLAWQYLYEPLETPADAEPIFDRIRQLDADEQREFHDHVIDWQLQGMDLTGELNREVQFNRALHEKRIELGIGMLDATADEIDTVIADVVASSLTPRAACSTASFPSSLTEKNCCAPGAIAAIGYDRRDNEPEAFPACDYRFRFSTATKRYYVGGYNAATLCVLSHNNGSLLSS